MKIRFEDLIGFVKVVEFGSFQRAADDMCLTQSALSQRIKKLEEGLGSKLLDRTTRSTELTAVGREFLPMAQRSVGTFDRTVANIQEVIQVRSGLLAVATNTTVSDSLMPMALQQFCNAYPGIHVRLVNMSGPAVADSVLNGDVDLGIARMTEAQADLEFEPLIFDKFHVICRSDHSLAQWANVTWAELARFPLINLRPNTGAARAIEHALSRTKITLKSRCEVSHLSAQLSLVAKDIGVAAAPGLALLKRPDLDLVARPLGRPEIKTELGVIQLRGRTLSPAATALAEIIRTVVSSSLQFGPGSA